MNYYIIDNRMIISEFEIQNNDCLAEAAARELILTNGQLHHVPVFLNNLTPKVARAGYFSSTADRVMLQNEDLTLLEQANVPSFLPDWLTSILHKNGAQSLNIGYPNWKQHLMQDVQKRWRINIVGLGDVGSTLTTGLRLLGDSAISEIGIFDLDCNKVQRHLLECNQILSPFGGRYFPRVSSVEEDSIFDCEMFVFCVTAGVPAVGDEGSDVRLAQYKANARIIQHYAKQARNAHFEGIFAVVSDPVDQLCKAAYEASNTNEDYQFDGKGLLPDKIRGYGLGVMNARATFYADEQNKAPHYRKEGRAFGPHGEGLVIADSIQHYDHELSLYLTEKAKSANLIVRNLGYKPYIAPALSSAALSIIDTINGNWHYSSNFIGGVYMGAKNRLTPFGTELEQNVLPDLLKVRLMDTYGKLRDFHE